MILKILFFHILVTLFGASGYIFFNSSHHLPGFILGSTIMAINWIVLIFTWRLIFEKNLIALGVSLIVIKYAFLILIIYLIISTKMVDMVSFMVGISTAILAGIVYFTRTFLVGIRKKE